MASGTLYLVATPIGNLSDMTERAKEILSSVDLIAAEDTRNSRKLLTHFQIRTPMTAYHEFNRFDKADALVRMLKDGKNIACITDAGTPGISDPGEVLVQKAAEAGATVTAVPGASACISALVISGLSTRRFRFEAFLPNEKKEREMLLHEVKEDTATLIFYEAPHRLKKTLEILCDALGDRKIAIVKELTKIHEKVIRTTLQAALTLYETEEPRGEYVLVIEGKTSAEKQEEAQKAWAEMSIGDHQAYYEAQGIERKEAMKCVARDRGISKREVYQALVGDGS